MPATGADIPPELFKNIAGGAAQYALRHWQVKEVGNISLVCLHWGKQWRRALWQDRVIKISSKERAEWFRDMATMKGSERLTPVVDLIKGVHVVQSQDIKQSWLQVLYTPSTRHKLETWTLVGAKRASRSKLKSPHWNMMAHRPPALTPYRVVELKYVKFKAFSDILKLLHHFRSAEEFDFEYVSWEKKDEPGVNTELAHPGELPVARRYRPIRSVCITYPSEKFRDLSLAHLCLEAFQFYNGAHPGRSPRVHAEVECLEELIIRASKVHMAARSIIPELKLVHEGNQFRLVAWAGTVRIEYLQLSFSYSPVVVTEGVTQMSVDRLGIIWDGTWNGSTPFQNSRQVQGLLAKLSMKCQVLQASHDLRPEDSLSRILAFQSSIVKLISVRTLVLAISNFAALQLFVDENLRERMEEGIVSLYLACQPTQDHKFEELKDRIEACYENGCPVGMDPRPPWVLIDPETMKPTGMVWPDSLMLAIVSGFTRPEPLPNHILRSLTVCARNG